MKEKTRNYSFAFLVILSLITALGTFVYGMKNYHTDNISINQRQEITSLSEGWYYIEEGKKAKISSLPVKIKDSGRKSLTIYLDLSKPAAEDAVLCMENFHQAVEVFAGDRKLYSYGAGNKGPAGWILGNIWNIIDLPEGVQGKTIAVKITSPNTPGRWKIPEIKYGNRSAVMQMISENCIGIAVFAILSGVLGSGFLLVFCLLRWKGLDYNSKDFVYIGLFIVISTLWIITDSKIPQFLTKRLTPIYILSFLLFTLMPVPYLMFLRQICRHGKGALDCLSILFLLQTIFCAVLYITGTVDLIMSLPVTHFLIICTVAASIFLCLRELLHYHNKDTFFVLIGICILAAGAMLSLAAFLPQKISDNSLFFRIGLIGFYLSLCYVSLRRGMGLLRTSMEAETYRRLAYKDAMTGIGNRAAFDRDAGILHAKRDTNTFAVAVFDVNNLKYTNDTYGHAAGDRLIKDTADSVKDAFSAIGRCYRIGGDEFAVIMEHIPDESIEEAFCSFRENIRKYGEGNPEGLDAAGGWAKGENTGTDFIYRLFHQADTKMYESKEKAKHAEK